MTPSTGTTRRQAKRDIPEREVEAAILRVAEWVEEHVGEIADLLYDRMRDEVPEYFDGINPAMKEVGRGSIVATPCRSPMAFATVVLCRTVYPRESSRRCSRQLTRAYRGSPCCGPMRLDMHSRGS
jgi:hypothetical protein